jgi:hypothetical protein
MLRKEKQKQLTIALDLEGTLISNAVSQFPRPGLFVFLEYCHQNFNRLVIFTAVNEVRFRSIARTLAENRDVPDWFVDLEYINWHWWSVPQGKRIAPIQENGIIFDNIESGSILPSSGSLLLADSRFEIRQCDPLTHPFYARVILTRSR